MYGWMGTILKVNLSSGEIEKEIYGEELRHDYIGGRGVNARLLYDLVKPGTDAFSENNALIFGLGPATGTLIASGRLHVTSMSPISKIYADSNGGSHFAPMLKWAGYDHIIFTGISAKPVYLWIDDDQVELRDANFLQGQTTDMTEKLIRQEHGDDRIEVTSIGPAGENLVKLSCIVVGGDGICGKCGLGAVMGAKKLKAVAVRGTKSVKVPDPESYREKALEWRNRLMKCEIYDEFSKQGTRMFVQARNDIGGLALKGGQEAGSFEGIDKISGETLYKEYAVKEKACFGCANHCRNWFQIKDGPFEGLKGVGIELTAQESWGSLLDNDYAPSLYKATILCNQYGIDSYGTGQLIGTAFEWYQNGIITKEDTGGLELKWGDYDAALALLMKIINREDIGNLLAEDVYQAAKTLGKDAEKYVTTFKKLIKNNVEVRVSPVYYFGHGVSPRGADHLRGSCPGPGTRGTAEGEVEIPDTSIGVAETVYENHYVCTLSDMLGICRFHTTYNLMPMDVKALADLLEVTTGMVLSEQEMRHVADRVWILERALGVREGITRKDDYPVGRYANEEVKGGPYDGFKIDRKTWDRWLDRFYEIGGWDKESGIPTKETLMKLGLNDIADDFERLGIFPPESTT